jgi:predicted ATPase
MHASEHAMSDLSQQLCHDPRITVYRLTLLVIRRFSANNFRSLVNFDMSFDSFAMLCGPNGAGKSSVLDALSLVRGLSTGELMFGPEEAPGVLSQLELTKWMSSRQQQFEVEVSVHDLCFVYTLHLEQLADFQVPRVVFESATCDGSLIFERDLEGVRFQRADGATARFPLNWRQAALFNIRPEGAKIASLVHLQHALETLLIVQPNPRSFELESRRETKRPDASLNNLVSWYRSLSLDSEWIDELRGSLQQIWPDFAAIRMIDVGANAKVLQLRFDHDGAKTLFSTNELSDGERALLALYMIRAAVAGNSLHSVFIDEPDNFVGVQELQPWVLAMREQLDDQRQLVLISHHPEILTSGGQSNARYISRENHNSPSKHRLLSVPGGISLAEGLARGWVDGE